MLIEFTLGAFLLLLIAVLLPIFSSIVLTRVCGLDRSDSWLVLFYGAGISPALLAWFLEVLFRFLPEQSISFYATFLVSIILAILIAGSYLICAKTEYDKGPIFPNFLKISRIFPSAFEVSLAGFLCVIMITAMVYNLAQPLRAHDPIVHTYIAQLIYGDLSLSAYPFAEPHHRTGYLFEAVHPLGYPFSKLIFMVLTGNIDTPWHKPMAGAYFAYLIIATGVLASRMLGLRNGILAGLLIALSPLMAKNTFIAHIDPLRVYFFFVPFVFFYEYLKSNKIGWLWISGLCFALALNVHTGNLILLFFIGPVFLLLNKESLPKKIGQIAVIGLIAFIIASPQYIDNLVRYGSPLGGNEYQILSQVPTLQVEAYSHLMRGISTLYEKIYRGSLAPFTNFKWFAFTYWLGLIGLIVYLRGNVKKAIVNGIVILPVVIYFGFQIIAQLIGYDAFYKNSRYALIVLPFMAILGSIILRKLVMSIQFKFENLVSYESKRRSKTLFVSTINFLPLLTTIIVLSGVLFYIYYFASSVHLPWWGPHQISQTDFYKVNRYHQDRIANKSASMLQLLPSLVARNTIQPGENTLIFRDAEFPYYSLSNVISEYDQRLIPFYSASNQGQAEEVLNSLNIKYFYNTPYSKATSSNSFFKNILLNPGAITPLSTEGYNFLKYHYRKRPYKIDTITSEEFNSPIKININERIFWPTGLSKCISNRINLETGFLNKVIYKFSKIITKFIIDLDDTCKHNFNKDNYFSFKKSADYYRIVFDLEGHGCTIGRLILLKSPKEQKREILWHHTVNHISIEKNSTGVMFFKQLPNTTGFAVYFTNSCNLIQKLKRVRIEAITYLSPPTFSSEY